MNRVGGNCLQLGQGLAQIVWRVFAINQQPVKSGARQGLGGIGVGQAKPKPDLGRALTQCLLEGINRDLHGGSLNKTKIQLTHGAVSIR